MSRMLSNLLVRLHGSLQTPPDQVSDADLLDRFVRSQDAAAFELLFWRHGPMIRGVCQRLLGNAPDADDAFQATLLVLTRKAHSVGRGAALAGWLHRVAWRTALNARKLRSNRALRFRPLDEFPDTPDRDDPVRRATDNDSRALLDRELARLPEKLRLPVILCDLEARSHAAAAAELKCPLGTLNSRLARAREKLRKQLLRRGVSPAGLAVITSAPCVAPAALHALAQEPSALVQSLASRVMRSMALVAIAKVASALAVCGLVIAGIAFGAAARTEEPPSRPDVPAKAAEDRRLMDVAAGPLPAGAIARVGSPRLRHTAGVSGLAYSPDGKWLASVSTERGDGTARLWSAATGKEQFRVTVAIPEETTGKSPCRALGFSPDSTRFHLVDSQSFRTFDVVSGKEVFASRFIPEGLIGTALAPDGLTFVLVLRNETFEVRATATGMIRSAGKHPFRDYSSVTLVYSPDSRRFVINSVSKVPIPVFETDSGRELCRIEAEGQQFNQMLFSAPAGDMLVGLYVPDYEALNRKNAAPGMPQTPVGVFDSRTGRLLRKINVDLTAAVLAVSPDGKLLVAGNAQKHHSQVFDFASGKEIGQIESWPGLFTLAFSPDGKLLAGSKPYHGAISVWEVASLRYHSTSATPASFHGTTFTTDSRALVVRGRGGPIVDWRTGKVIRHLADVEPEGPISTFLSPDLKIYAVPDWHGPIKLHDAEAGKELRTLNGHSNLAGRIVFSRDSRRLASCSYDKSIRVWEVSSGRELASFKPPELFGAEEIALSEDGRALAVSCMPNAATNNTVYVWKVDTKTQLARIEVPNRFFHGIALSADGRLLAAGGGADRSKPGSPTAAFIWNARTGQEIHSLPGHDARTTHPGVSCSFSPDGRWLSTGAAAGQLRVWETLTGQEVHHFEGHHGTVTANFSPDGRLLVAASEEAPCLVWDVTGRAPDGQLRIEPLAPARLNECWTDLGDPDAAKAYRALWSLVADPEHAVPLLRERVKPLTPPEAARLARMLAALDADAFRDREKAVADLKAFGDEARPALEKLRDGPASLECQRRAKEVLDALAISTEWRRTWRAVTALEYMATPAARQVLETLAGGLPEARLTAEARMALKRLTEAAEQRP
jgi:RNA polymerase sigma factor (sigma-70 family)